MKERGWKLRQDNLLEADISSFTDLTPLEQENLSTVMIELKGWATHNIDQILSVMAEDLVFYDITMTHQLTGHQEMRKFAHNMLDPIADFTPCVESFVVKGDTVVNMGHYSGIVEKEFFGMPATGKRFDCPYCQVAVLQEGKIKYMRDHWNLVDMYQQMGWDCGLLNTGGYLNSPEK